MFPPYRSDFHVGLNWHGWDKHLQCGRVAGWHGHEPRDSSGPPEGSLQIINNAGAYAVAGAAGPYVVISGVGSLSLEGLTLNGYFYFQVSDSSTGALSWNWC